MTDKERMVWDIVSDFHRKLDLLDQGYADASCRIDHNKSFEEIQAEADRWYESRKEKMVQKLISELEPIMRGGQI